MNVSVPTQNLAALQEIWIPKLGQKLEAPALGMLASEFSADEVDLNTKKIWEAAQKEIGWAWRWEEFREQSPWLPLTAAGAAVPGVMGLYWLLTASILPGLLWAAPALVFAAWSGRKALGRFWEFRQMNREQYGAYPWSSPRLDAPGRPNTYKRTEAYLASLIRDRAALNNIVERHGLSPA